MKLKNWELSLIIAIVAALFFTSAASLGQRELSNKLVRLHVVANSDSEEDQALKLRVRDAVLETLAEPLSGVTDAAAAQQIITESFPLIGSAARNEIHGSGFDYSVAVSLAREEYPTREYDTFSLPAGEYTSLRVELGAAAGRNWWCVVFPPLCTEAAAYGDSAEALALLDDDEVKLITEEEGYVVKFKCIELLSSLKTLFNR